MAEILLFHHAQGLTEGLRFLCERVTAAGHTVHAPDMFDGAVFEHLDDGIAFASKVGHDTIEARARAALHEHPHADTVMGISLGVFPAQLLAQEFHGIRNCVLVCGGMSPCELRGEWRHNVRLALHAAEPDDELPREEVDPLLAHAPHATVYRYRGTRHLFIDPSCKGYDADAADLFEERLLDWLDSAD